MQSIWTSQPYVYMLVKASISQASATKKDLSGPDATVTENTCLSVSDLDSVW